MTLPTLRLVVISGRSGSGKSTALHLLEDLGFTCIDNLPASLLPALFEELKQTINNVTQIAVGIDARNLLGKLDPLHDILETLRATGIQCDVIFLDAHTPILLRRYSETRRRHPLSSTKIDLQQALAKEKQLLDPIAAIASRQIDTSNMTLHQLRDVIKKQVAPNNHGEMAILFTSFGFKYGVPLDSDYVFDVRHLPNPYWHAALRPLTGQDPDVIQFLASQNEVKDMLNDIGQFLQRWLPHYAATNRSYLTVAIGCTGGQHRSVYICSQLQAQFSKLHSNVQLRHRELNPINQSPISISTK